MESPRILLVRETPSLADSVQLLLETVGYRVVPVNSLPLPRRKGRARETGEVGAVIVACNEPTSAMLDRLPGALPEAYRGAPTIVLGRPAREEQSTAYPGVRFVGLPLDASSFIGLVGSLVGRDGTAARATPAPAR
ncbi:MAG TPA: hypothetical protein VEH57_00090 [Thermoplasmata archaeon]|nr:hypothetical protein [Thermoplasmata archaeon]